MSKGKIILYNTGHSEAEVHLQLVNGMVWITQAQVANFFSANFQAITQLIRSTYRDEYLNEVVICKELSQVQIDELKRIAEAINEQRKVGEDG